MVLKTDYKDAMYDGARKWRITQNADGTSGIADERDTQDGDKLGQTILMPMNKEINRINHTTEVTLTASGWTGSAAPFSQTVNVTGATSDLEVILVSALADGANAATRRHT